MCLDVLRALEREPDAVAALTTELGASRGAERTFDAFIDQLLVELSTPAELSEARGRSVVARLAIALQGALLVRHGHPGTAAGFLRSRIGGEHGNAFGTLGTGIDVEALVERARPKVSPTSG